MKNVITIAAVSITSCLLYSLMLGSAYNHYFYTSLAKLILFLAIPLVYIMLTKHERFRDFFRIKGNKKYIKISAALGITTFALILLGFAALYGFFDRQMIADGLAKEGITKATYPYVFVYIVFINAFLEELFFRGFVFAKMFRLGYEKFAYIFSSVLFAVYHIAMMNSWFSPPIFTLCLAGLTAAGLIFCELHKRCECVTGAAILHVSANMAINLIGAWVLYF